jgi:hypothetical protein
MDLQVSLAQQQREEKMALQSFPNSADPNPKSAFS